MKLRPLQDRVRFVTPERNGLFPFNPFGRQRDGAASIAIIRGFTETGRGATAWRGELLQAAEQRLRPFTWCAVIRGATSFLMGIVCNYENRAGCSAL